MVRVSQDSDHDGRLPVSAGVGRCGVTVMPRDRVVVTGPSGFLLLTESQAWDLESALRTVRQELEARP